MSRRPLPRDTLARNLRHLMAVRGWSDRELAKKSGISHKTINNLLNDRHPPNLETVDAVARAYGLEAWHLILPNLPAELASDGSVGRLFRDFLASDPEGKQAILGLASREAARPASK